jgi:hypothetical protein
MKFYSSASVMLLNGPKIHNCIPSNPYRLTIQDTLLNLYGQSMYRMIFFCGEGPRSRRYGRTAALRLLVKPCDEDDDDDDYFCPFPSNGAPVE